MIVVVGSVGFRANPSPFAALSSACVTVFPGAGYSNFITERLCVLIADIAVLSFLSYWVAVLSVFKSNLECQSNKRP